MQEEQQAATANPQSININDIFNKKVALETEEEKPVPVKEQVKKILKIKKEAPPVEVEDNDDEEPIIPAKEPEVPSPKNDGMDYKSEYEKLQKRVESTQKSFHQDRMKLSAYKKAVEKMKADGVLLDEEAENLLDHTKYEEAETEDESDYLRYHKIWSNELQYMKKYSSDSKQVDQYFQAFQHFVQTAAPNEIQDVFAELSQYEADEVEFTKQMLEFGRQYNEEVYEDLHESGSIRKLKAKYIEKQNESQKKIDKLEKYIVKLKSKYEDYDTEPANLALPSSTSYNDLPIQPTFDPKAIYDKRWKKR